jgi:DNA-binding NarL/FixJ family response regulator
VIELVGKGYTNNAIARSLGCTRRTVEFHLSNAYERLGAGCRTEAVVAAMRLGYLSSDPDRST